MAGGSIVLSNKNQSLDMPVNIQDSPNPALASGGGGFVQKGGSREPYP